MFNFVVHKVSERLIEAFISMTKNAPHWKKTFKKLDQTCRNTVEFCTTEEPIRLRKDNLRHTNQSRKHFDQTRCGVRRKPEPCVRMYVQLCPAIE